MYDLTILDALLADDTVLEILINGHDQVFACRQAFLIEDTAVHFENADHLLAYLKHLLPQANFSAENPIIEEKLADGTRVNVVMPPIAPLGIAVNIRRVFIGLPDWENLIEREFLTQKMLDFLRWSVRNWANIMVIGGTGSGKTSFMNILANEILPAHRVIHIEDDSDMHLNLPHQVRLETRRVGQNTTIDIRQLFQLASKMRPDNVVCSEVRGLEAYDMLNLIATGVDGSFFSMHANNLREALNRLEIWCTEANPSAPLTTLRQHIANTINLVVTCEILHDGRRRLVKLSELSGVNIEGVVIRDIFEFVPTGMNENGDILGEYRTTGYVPTFTQTIRSTGHQPLPDDFFAI